MQRSQWSRRELFGVAGGAIVLPLIGVGCAKKELACADTGGLLPDEVAMRETQQYVDLSADPAKNCANCQLYKPAAPDQCGGCGLLKGTINPKGNCKSWAAKKA